MSTSHEHEPQRPLLHEELDHPIDYIECLRDYLEWVRLHSDNVAKDLIFAQKTLNTSLIMLYDEEGKMWNSNDVEELEGIARAIASIRSKNTSLDEETHKANMVDHLEHVEQLDFLELLEEVATKLPHGPLRVRLYDEIAKMTGRA